MRGRPPKEVLPHWPALMPLELAARYLAIDEHSFGMVVRREAVAPVELGLNLVRWRKSDLDQLVTRLPATQDIPVKPRAVREEPRAPQTRAPPLRLVEEPRKAEALGITEAAKAIGVGRSTLYNLISSGRLPTVRLGRRRLIKRADLMRLLEDE